MITTNLSTLKIHKLTQEQYNRELAAGRLDENAIYLTPDSGSSDNPAPSIDTSTAVGVWVLNDTLTKVDADLTQGSVEINCVGYAPVNSSARPEQFSKILFLGEEDHWSIELYLSEFDQYVGFYSSSSGFSIEFEEKTLVFLEEIEEVAFMDWLRANATKTPSSIEPELDTVSKTIVEAINEVNSSIVNIPSIDNIEYMDFTGEGTEVYVEDVGIMWDVQNADISSMAGPAAYFRVPIAAGEGIEFVPGEEGQIVNIGLNEETREAIANGSESSVFVAMFNETTSQEIIDAHNAGCIVQLRDEFNIAYTLAAVVPEEACVFTACDGFSILVRLVMADDTWESYDYSLPNGDEYYTKEDVDQKITEQADKSEGTFFIVGSGTTDSTAKTSTWIGTSDRITEYYDGLAIRYKIGVAGQTTTTLNINGLGAKRVYRFSTTALTTQFPVGSIINLVYHTDLNSGCWMCNDYDANTNTYQRVYESSGNTEYAITARYATTDGASYYAEYGRYTNGVTLNPSTNTITASKFKGALTGNADTATKATQDASGNVITSTYETKTDATTKFESMKTDETFQAAVAQKVIDSFGTPVYGIVDGSNDIVLVGGLTGGPYTIKYEDENGNVTVIGTLSLPGIVSYTNLLALATDESGAVWNGVGYRDGNRLSGNNGTLSMDTSGTTGYFSTGFMPYTLVQLENRVPMYIKGITLDLTAELPQYLRFGMAVPGSDEWVGMVTLKEVATAINGFDIIELADNYYKFTPRANTFRCNGWDTGWPANTFNHMRWTLPGSGAGVIITVNEPIE